MSSRIILNIGGKIKKLYKLNIMEYMSLIFLSVPPVFLCI